MQNFRRKVIQDDICDKLGLSNDLPPTHQKLSRALKYLRKEDGLSLDFSNNHLTDMYPFLNIPFLNEVKYLDLSHNNFRDEDLKTIVNILKRIKGVLDVRRNEFMELDTAVQVLSSCNYDLLRKLRWANSEYEIEMLELDYEQESELKSLHDF